MEVPDRAVGPSPSDFSLGGVFSGPCGSESRNEEKEGTMLSAVVLASSSQRWPGTGQAGAGTASLVGLGATFNAVGHYRRLVASFQNCSPQNQSRTKGDWWRFIAATALS